MWWPQRIEELEKKVARLEEDLKLEMAAQKIINAKTIMFCQEITKALERVGNALTALDSRLKPIEGEMSHWKDFTHWACKTKFPVAGQGSKPEKES